MNKTAIIFGVTGQIGSYLLDKLLQENFYVYGVARRISVDNTERIRHNLANKKLTLLSGDITDPHSIFSIFSRWSRFSDDVIIFNMAAQSFVTDSFCQPSLTLDITGKGVLNILEGIRGFQNPSRVKFIQMSSSEMFGSNVDYDDYQRITTPFKPNSPYGAAKLLAHSLVDVYRRSYDINAGCVIGFNNESPRRGREFVTRKITKWIGEFVANDRKFSEKLKLGNLGAIRDWSHSKDMVEAIYLMSKQDKLKDYVVSSMCSHSILDFIKEAFSVINIDNYDDYIESISKFHRPCEVPFLRGDSSEIRKELGWSPMISFKSLVREMVLEDIRVAKWEKERK